MQLLYFPGLQGLSLLTMKSQGRPELQPHSHLALTPKIVGLHHWESLSTEQSNTLNKCTFTQITWKKNTLHIPCLPLHFPGYYRNVLPACCWEQLEGQFIWSYCKFPVFRHPTFMIITSSFSSLSVIFNNQRFSSCCSTMVVGLVRLSSDRLCGNRDFKMNIEFCYHFCCSRSMV
jgi:hypothetical protein